MKYQRRVILSIFWIVLGIVLIVLAIMEKVDSTMWSGFGGGLTAIGILQLIKHIRYDRNPEYRENFDTEVSDERNQFIRMKAWSWAGYLFVIAAAVATIVLMILQETQLMMVTSWSVCLIVLLYWVSYLALRKKY